MRPAPAGFVDALRRSHARYVRVRVLNSYQTGIPAGGTFLEVVDGEATFDAGADIRGQVDVTVIGRGLFDVDPDGGLGFLTPYSSELYVDVVYPAAQVPGGDVVVPFGYFRVYDLEEPDGPLGGVRIVARDRMSGIVDARFPRPRAYPPSWTFGDVVDQLARQVYPDVVIVWDDPAVADEQLGRRLFEERDRIDLLNDVARAAGKRAYWDGQGRLRLEDWPDGDAPPVWTVDAGADGVMVEPPPRTVTREGAYNAVVAEGESADGQPPVRAVAIDDDPNSPTRWGPPFGKVPRFYGSSLLTTNARARRAARSLLVRKLGLPYAIELTAVPNPTLEPDDVVAVVYPLPIGSQGRRTELHTLSEVTFPFVAADPQQLTTRESTTATIRYLDPGEE